MSVVTRQPYGGDDGALVGGVQLSNLKDKLSTSEDFRQRSLDMLEAEDLVRIQQQIGQDLKGKTNIKTWIIKHINCFLWDTVNHPCPNFNGGLAKPPLKLGHG